jgi:hypothetical protein
MRFGRNIYTASETMTVRFISTQKMELARPSETIVTTHGSTLRHIPEVTPSEFNDENKYFLKFIFRLSKQYVFRSDRNYRNGSKNFGYNHS